jgi:hypothetical protein
MRDVWRYMGMICNNFPQIPQMSSSRRDFDNRKLLCTRDKFEMVSSIPVIESAPSAQAATSSQSATTSQSQAPQRSNVYVSYKENNTYMLSYSQSKRKTSKMTWW